jgi:drug/metabolite transporter (DMT)-like permease
MSDQRTADERKAELLLFIVVLIWASNYPIAKWSMSELSPLMFNSIRYIVASLVLAILFFSRATWMPIARGDWYKLVRAGIVANVIYQMGFIVGLYLTTAGNSAVLLATSPLWTIFLGSRLHKDAVSRHMWLGMAISLCGVVMIIVGSGKRLAFGETELYGDLISLGAAAFWGLSNNLQKPLVARYPSLQVSLVMIVVGTVVLGCVSIPQAVSMAWTTIGWSYLLAAILSGALSIGIANFFWSIGVKYLGPGRTSGYSNLIPVLAFVISYLTLDEQLSSLHFMGATVTIAGVWLTRR